MNLDTLQQHEVQIRLLERHITRLQRYIRTLETRSHQFTRWRIMAFFGGFIAVVGMFGAAILAGILAFLVWVIGFGLLVVRHRRVDQTLERFKIWQMLKRESVARLRLQWDGLPDPLPVELNGHPFALDLNLYGRRSIHHLMDTAITDGGSRRLGAWLWHSIPNHDTIMQHQALVRELIPLTTFREKLALAAKLNTLHSRQPRWNPERFNQWLQHEQANEAEVIPRRRLGLLCGLSLVNITLLLLASADVLPMWGRVIWAVSIVIYVVLTGTHFRVLRDLFGQAIALENEVVRLNQVLRFLETYRYAPNSHLHTLCEPFFRGNDRPSHLLVQLQRIVTATSLQRNPILWATLNLAVPWDIFFALRLQHSKRKLAQVLPVWLDRLYELEALNALAHFAYLNPAYTFPIISSETIFEAKQIGHPLIPPQDRVCNDFTLIGTRQLVMMTGSNMSGKSSFLRTVGVNLCLAYAGSVVCAESLNVGLFRLFTCINVSDSVVDGISYFYAEVKRLKALLNALHEHDVQPLFYLIDEIFRGTNNRERLIGSRAYIRALVSSADANGMGLISTHDLELTKLADEHSQLRNMHFREEVRDGQMVFDYHLREGASPTTNALKIMALEGLPVTDVL